jgi:hypothetical protein
MVTTSVVPAASDNDLRAMVRARQQRLHGHSLAICHNYNTHHAIPWESLIDKKLSLLAPFSVAVFRSIMPITITDERPIYFCQILEIITTF